MAIVGEGKSRLHPSLKATIGIVRFISSLRYCARIRREQDAIHTARGRVSKESFTDKIERVVLNSKPYVSKETVLERPDLYVVKLFLLPHSDPPLGHFHVDHGCFEDIGITDKSSRLLHKINECTITSTGNATTVAANDRLLLTSEPVIKSCLSHAKRVWDIKQVETCIARLETWKRALSKEQQQENAQSNEAKPDCRLSDPVFVANLEYILRRQLHALLDLLLTNIWLFLTATVCVEEQVFGYHYFAEHRDPRRLLSTTWPWNIRPSLVVLWGVCWMFAVYPPHGRVAFGTAKIAKEFYSLPPKQGRPGDKLSLQPCGPSEFPNAPANFLSSHPSSSNAPTITYNFASGGINPNAEGFPYQASMPTYQSNDITGQVQASSQLHPLSAGTYMGHHPPMSPQPQPQINARSSFASTDSTTRVSSHDSQLRLNSKVGTPQRTRSYSKLRAGEVLEADYSTPYSPIELTPCQSPSQYFQDESTLFGGTNAIPSNNLLDIKSPVGLNLDLSPRDASFPYPSGDATGHLVAPVPKVSRSLTPFQQAPGPIESPLRLQTASSASYISPDVPLSTDVPLLTISSPYSTSPRPFPWSPAVNEYFEHQERLGNDYLPRGSELLSESTYTGMDEGEAGPNGPSTDGGHATSPSSTTGSDTRLAAFYGKAPKREAPRDEHGKTYCELCKSKGIEASFKRRCEWSKHMDKHERPYRCSETSCEKLKGFTYYGGLSRHQREVHGKSSTAGSLAEGGSMNSTRNSLFCPHENCKRSTGTPQSPGKGFTRRENLNEHLRRVHRDSTDGLAAEENGAEMLKPNGTAAAISQPTIASAAGHKRKRSSASTVSDDSEAHGQLEEEVKRLKTENEGKAEEMRLMKEKMAKMEQWMAKMEQQV